MDRKGKKSRSEPLTISDLPSDLIDAILVRLPLRDAVRTSILSRQWRYKWTTMTELDFLDWDWEVLGTIQELSTVIDRALMLHAGPIHTFGLTANLDPPPPNLDHWLIYLTKNGIRKLSLELSTDDSLYTVHSSVFYCQSIAGLNLNFCAVKLPPFFEGFANLSSLALDYVRVSEGDLHSLISNCALVEKLWLNKIEGCDCYRISSPRLRSLSFDSKFTDFRLVTTPALATLLFWLLVPTDVDLPREGDISNLSKILASANSVERLVLGRYSSQFLAAGCKPEKLPVVFERLQSLKLSIRFTGMEQVSPLLSLLRSSPCLRELTLEDVGSGGVEIVADNKVWEMHEDTDVFEHLRLLKIIDFSCIQPEMEFIEYVLGHAPVLQKMEIKINPQPGTSREQVFIQLMEFQRASSQARIIYIK